MSTQRSTSSHSAAQHDRPGDAAEGDRRPERPAVAPPENRDTRDRLIEAISAHGPITARLLAERFELTSAAVRRHLAALEAEGIIEEHDVPVTHRGRGRPSKSFVLSKSAHEDFPGGYDELAVLALDELARSGGDEAVARLAERRVEDWERKVAERAAEREADGEELTTVKKLEILSELLTERGYATTVRPLSVSLPSTSLRSGAGTRTLVTAQLCHGRCPVLDVAADHPELCEAETRVISRLIGAPVQRLATLAQGAHVCTTHIPLTEGRTP